MSQRIFYCDNCRNIIKDIEDGNLEWYDYNLANGTRESDGLQIVHKIKCSYKSDELYKNKKATLSDIDLKYICSEDGLMYLLSMISDNNYYNFKNIDDLLEIIKRTHIRDYEFARRHIDEAIFENIYEPNGPKMFPNRYYIDKIIKIYKK